ncbi:MAG: DUF1002 domain-containing protein [Anaerovoracaceae bacterium]|jgi:uncharacterized protein YpuA (DUF1002 family)
MKRFKHVMSAVLALVMLLTCASPVFADSSDTYVALGADLSSSQRAQVLQMLGLTEDDLKDISVTTITNQMEKDELGDYLPASVIGSRALSSVKVVSNSSGGINVTTQNISYCTVGMYKNALITAGVENADVTVAAPTYISGTAGLVGAMKAYEGLTGDNLSSDNQDAAVNELVTTGELADQLGNTEDAENLIALTKQKVASENLSSDEDILNAIKEAANELNISITDDQAQMILDLMKKISKLNLSEDQLRQQASDIYDRLQDLGIDMSQYDKQTFIDKVSSLFGQFIDFCKSLFS